MSQQCKYMCRLHACGNHVGRWKARVFRLSPARDPSLRALCKLISPISIFQVSLPSVCSLLSAFESSVFFPFDSSFVLAPSTPSQLAFSDGLRSKFANACSSSHCAMLFIHSFKVLRCSFQISSLSGLRVINLVCLLLNAPWLSLYNFCSNSVSVSTFFPQQTPLHTYAGCLNG